MSGFLVVLLAAAVAGIAPDVHASRVPASATSAGRALPQALRPIVPAAPTGPGNGPVAVPRCTDPASTWLGARWRRPLRWHVQTGSIPAYLGASDEVVRLISSAAGAVADGRNDCGLPDDLDIPQRFLGTTSRPAAVTEAGDCGTTDGHSTVAFAALAAGLLAVTCIWWFGGSNDGRIIEADIRISNTDGLFVLQPAAGCSGRFDLPGTMTHEFGHVFGLGHVPYAQHGGSTMADGLNDCLTIYRGLGLGEYLELQRRYTAA